MIPESHRDVPESPFHTGTGRHFTDPLDRVRDNAGSAGLAAGLLILFGFFWFGGETQTGWVGTGESVVRLAFQVGGIVMVAIAVWSAIGHPPALMADAVASILIGLTVLAGAVCVMIGGGPSLAGSVYVVCGLAFVAAGLRDWRDFGSMPIDAWTTRQDGADEFQPVDSKLQDWKTSNGDPSVSSSPRRSIPGVDQPGTIQSVSPSPGNEDLIRLERSKSPSLKKPTFSNPEDRLVRLDDLPPQSPSEGNGA